MHMRYFYLFFLKNCENCPEVAPPTDLFASGG